MSPQRRRRLTRTLILAPIILVLIATGAYTAVAATAPLPELTPTLTVEPTSEYAASEATAQSAVDEQTLPTAVGWLHEDAVWTNSEEPQRIASLTKLITVLVGLDHTPLGVGEDGPSLTLTAADEALLIDTWAENGLGYAVPVGESLTMRQILQLILIPSANNYADSYARWIFGSEESFLSEARAWLTEHGLTSVHIVDPSGLSDDNVATPADLVRLSRMALEQPVVAEIVAQTSAEIPGLGLVENTNRLLGEPGVIGIKTGTTFPDGYSLSAAQEFTIGDRTLVAIAVTNDRPNGEERTADTREALAALGNAHEAVTIGEPNEVVGSVTTWLGERVPIVLNDAVELTLVPGEHALRSLDVEQRIDAEGIVDETSSGTIAAGLVVGSATFDGPDGTVSQPMLTASTFEVPDLWWRLTHPAELFGW